MDNELASNKGDLLVGNTIMAADIMVHFSVQLTFARELSVEDVETTRRKNVAQWVEKCEGVRVIRRGWRRRDIHCSSEDVCC